MQKIISILVSLSILFTPQLAIAGRVTFHPAEHVNTQAGAFTTTLVLDTQGDNINTIEGVLTVDPRLSGNIQVSESGSFIVYWVESPQFDRKTNLIRFSGAIPGGYTGTTGILLSIIFQPYDGEPIDQAVKVTELKAYRNDGLASDVAISSSKFSLGDVAGESDKGIQAQLYLDGKSKDNIPPEVFSPQIARTENAYEGKWFVSFSTVDKQSGIDHYEVQESLSGGIDSGRWIVTASPYVLQDQELHSYVYVIAVDKQGNERIIKVFPRNALPWYRLYAQQLIALLVVGVAAGTGYYYKRRRKGQQPALRHEK